jgi:hypothetical protein
LFYLPKHWDMTQKVQPERRAMGSGEGWFDTGRRGHQELQINKKLDSLLQEGCLNTDL